MTPAERVDDTPTVAVSDAKHTVYPAQAPYDPPERYPELAAGPGGLDPSNHVYPAVREALRLLGLDAGRYGTAQWNPLGDLVRPGHHVVIKPNLVRHFHGGGLGVEGLVTHGSVVRAVLDYVLLALKGEGRITVGDAPLQYSEMPSTMQRSGLGDVLESARQGTAVPIRALDFRKERSEKRDGIIVARVPNNGDPEGYRVVDLKSKSRFTGMPRQRTERFRVTQYDPSTMARAHGDTTHAYLIPASVLSADVFINVPKLKTHAKAGITGAMKNLVGINGSKDWLPHHTMGAVPDGGDEYLRRSARKRLVSFLKDRIEGRRGVLPRRTLHFMQRVVRATGKISAFPDPYWEGSWHGNDTLWRMVHDLHHVLFYADASGTIRTEPQRGYLAIVDAVVAGEGEGPMRPTPRPAGLVIAGGNPAAVDIVCCRLMGFDEHKIPLLRQAIGNGHHPGVASTSSIRVVGAEGPWSRPAALKRSETLRFAPPAGWVGAIEMDD